MNREHKYIGKPVLRKDALAKVTGLAKYPGDILNENALYMKILFSSKPHAIVHSVDISNAISLEGVHAIYTAKDVPNNSYGLMLADQPVLCGPRSNNEYGDRVRCVSDQVAVVVAENEGIAKKALKLIRVEYEDLPVVTDVDEAVKSETIHIHPENRSNIVSPLQVQNGDVGIGREKSKFIIENTYFTPVQEHAYLQPEAGYAYMDDQDRITIVVAGQWAHEDQEQIAHALNLPLEKIRVIYPAIGGAFGGREDMSVQIVLALAVMKLHEKGINRPIRITWSRAESIVGHHKRHPYNIHLKLGANANGVFQLLEADITADAGAYMYTSNKVLGNATLMVIGPYHIPNVSVKARAVYTNNLPNGAFRGFGAPQACFAIEMQINQLAAKMGMDPVELRLMNTIKEGQPTAVKSPLPEGVSIDTVINACSEVSQWQQKRQIATDSRANKSGEVLRGIGFAAGYKNVGFSFGAPESCWAEVELHGTKEIEKLILRHAGADVGQGAHTAFIQIAADTARIPIENVEIQVSDTAITGSSGSASASRMTFMAGNAIIGAVKGAMELWEKEERPAKKTYVYKPPKTTAMDPETGESTPNFAYGYVAEAVEVEVDTSTGKVRVINAVCADDVGKAINPIQVKGQIEGAIVQASGYTLLEKFVQKDGFVHSDSLATYLIPTIMDIPEATQSVIVETADPIGPAGARGMAEMPYIPFAPAVLSAVYDATGVWYTTFPLTEEVVLRGLGIID